MRAETVNEQVLRFIQENPGKSDGEINQELFGGSKNHAHINMACRWLELQGLVGRGRGDGKHILNFPSGAGATPARDAVLRMDICSVVAGFVGPADDEYHRYRSWDHCFEFFRNRSAIRGNAALLDHAALHLAWFLASWGMLRGAADLLWKNHRYLGPVVDAVLRPEFDSLLGFDPLSGSRSRLLEAVFASGGLVESIRRGFVEYDRTFVASDILVTKTMLGTLACSMAYDRYVSAGLKECGLTVKFGRRSLGEAFDFYVSHAEQFGEVRCGYPPFKLLDMYFFQLGQV